MQCFQRFSYRYIFSKYYAHLNRWRLPCSTRLVHLKPKEVSIQVPWGHIAGLHWNPDASGHPFLCLHGWKDNAGHGFSSHYPPGMLYQLVDHLVAIRRVISHFGWSEMDGIHLMGHSLGATLSFLFAASHPKLVDCVIAIDALLPIIFSQAYLIEMLSITTEGFLKIESTTRKTSTYAESRQKMLMSHMGINEITCDTLLTRGIVETAPNSGEWKFTHDPRVHFLPLMGISEDQIEHFAKAFQSKLLFIKAEDGVNSMSDYMQSKIQKFLCENNEHNVRFVTAKEATHHVHIIEPEKITPEILKFLKDTQK